MSKKKSKHVSDFRQVVLFLAKKGVKLPEGAGFEQAAEALCRVTNKKADFINPGTAKGFVINFGRGLARHAERLEEKRRKTENRAAAKVAQAKKAKAVKERRPPRNTFYQSAEWKRVRYEALKRSHGRCECCGVSASMGAVLNVDHIKPISRRPDLSLDLTNLQVLCGSCNQGKGGWDQTDWRGGHRMNALDKEYAAIMANS
ncbi:HNH endonuclease [Azospirillum sp. TSA6c]|uniref:HNH endonuclease n=1 Tax=Azospirillum sp. TSA6c TaxID=709813 RepID=UPI0011B6E4E6|nr:HNH endonuclease [Azospirillum sp. TSA6c]